MAEARPVRLHIRTPDPLAGLVRACRQRQGIRLGEAAESQGVLGRGGDFSRAMVG